MSFYSLLRVAHSYWRWAVVATALVVLIRAIAGTFTKRGWTHEDAQASRLFFSALDLQLLIGLVLYTVSPFSSAVFHSFGESMQSPVTRFFGIEHQTAMLFAWGAAHTARWRAKRADGSRKHRILAIVMLLVFVPLVAWAIPWPWRVVGRPLFRMEW